MNNQSAQSADSVGFLGAFCAFLIGWAIWHFFHLQIIGTLRFVRHGELWLLAQLPLTGGNHILQWKMWLEYTPTDKIEWPNIVTASRLVGHFFRWPVAAVLGTLAFFMVFRTPKTQFKKTYDLDRLIAAQAKVWPVITPIVNFNPGEDNARDPNGDVPKELPVFAEALSPDEWLKFHRVPHEADDIDREMAADLFAEQLGPRWHGPNALPWHAKGIFAAFALKAARKREEADALLGRMAMAVNPKQGMAFKPGFGLRREIQRIIVDPKIGGEAAKICDRHAYVTPALMRLLAYARDRGGVLAPAQFVWLRGADRALWYPLNNVGRQSFHCEAAGAMAHYMAELMAGERLLSPKVATAVECLRTSKKSKTLGLAE